jgi:tellurite resistance protein
VAWWAFTFPFVTMSSAALTYFELAPGTGSQAVAVITLVLTTVIVLVVALRTLRALLSGNLLKVPAG